MDNIASSIPIRQSLINVSPTSNLCPDIELGIVNDDGSQLNTVIFAYDKVSSEFWIDTEDSTNVDVYNLKVVVNFAGEIYEKEAEIAFTVTLIDYCADFTITNPGQSTTTTPKDYYYLEKATFDIIPFTVSPIECNI